MRVFVGAMSGSVPILVIMSEIEVRLFDDFQGFVNPNNPAGQNIQN